VPLVLLALKEFKEKLVQQAQMVLTELKEFRVRLVLQELPVPMVPMVTQFFMVQSIQRLKA
jgi:hypothetical protein